MAGVGLDTRVGGEANLAARLTGAPPTRPALDARGHARWKMLGLVEQRFAEVEHARS